MLRRVISAAVTALWWSLVFITSGPEAGESWTRRLLAHWLGLSGQALDLTNFVVRKAAHVFYYGSLTLLIALTAWRWLVSSRKLTIASASLLALATGVFDEARQAASDARSGTAIDLIYDTVGIALAALLFLRMSRTK